jgi:hypothetical protein
MAAGVPPPPLNSPTGSYYWLEWYTNLTNFLNGQNIPWSDLNFSGSNITDIVTRDHNSLQAIQGGNASGTTGPSGNAYHSMGYGYCNATASSSSAPTGWTIALTATGTYTITHNLNLTVPLYQAMAVSNTTGVMVVWVDTSSPNTIVVHTASSTALGTPTNGSISFWIGNV